MHTDFWGISMKKWATQLQIMLRIWEWYVSLSTSAAISVVSLNKVCLLENSRFVVIMALVRSDCSAMTLKRSLDSSMLKLAELSSSSSRISAEAIAFSSTNRIFDNTKMCGQVVIFSTKGIYKKAVDDAIPPVFKWGAASRISCSYLGRKPETAPKGHQRAQETGAIA